MLEEREQGGKTQEGITEDERKEERGPKYLQSAKGTEGGRIVVMNNRTS